MDRTLTDAQHETLDALADDGSVENQTRVVGWSDKYDGPIIHNVAYGSRAAITQAGAYRRVA